MVLWISNMLQERFPVLCKHEQRCEVIEGHLITSKYKLSTVIQTV